MKGLRKNMFSQIFFIILAFMIMIAVIPYALSASETIEPVAEIIADTALVEGSATAGIMAAVPVLAATDTESPVPALYD